MGEMSRLDYMKQIDEFELHYRYDCRYMRDLLATSPEGYRLFNNAVPLARHQELLDVTDYWIAKLAAMKVEDCGECLQLNVRMALEVGIDREVVLAAVNGGQGLDDELRDVYDYATAVASNRLDDDALVARIESRFSRGQLLEMGLCIGSAKLFPTMRRAAGYSNRCSVLEIAV